MIKLALFMFILTIEFYQYSWAQINKDTINFSYKKLEHGAIYNYKEGEGEILQFPITRGGVAIPNKFSLKPYCPATVYQVGPSCLSYAVAYYGMTTYERFKYKDTLIIPFSPMHLHLKMNKIFNKCDNEDGNFTDYTMAILNKFGVPRLNTDSYEVDCDSIDVFKVYPDRLDTWKCLNNTRENINSIKYSINNGQPVVCSIATNFSFDSYCIFNLELIKIQMKYEPSAKDENGGKYYTVDEYIKELDEKIELFSKLPTELCWNGKYPKEKEGPHAVCIVGYDDTKFGGAFEIVNSWSEYWGINGYLWIRYKDIYKMYPEFYSIGKLKK